MENQEKNFEAWDKMASLYEDKFMHMDLYDDTYALFCEHILKQNAKVLEIGCGPGNITQYLLSKKPDFKIDAIDAAANMVELAKKNNPNANFKVMDCRDLDKITTKYDAIICGFCMPYLSKADCAKLINDCATLLKNGGILYLSTIEGDYNQSTYETSSNGEYRLFVYYHETAYLQEMLNENNLDQLHLVRKEYPKGNEISTHSIFIAEKKSL
ncbi:class I SAM-dependent DNA methyltransferase [Pedobacter sp. UC225_61]|uniref:class I SAM-dependent DNA methyltransferase n=1 Tax=Pedobacter sp. UC225_61 TaxID=3374623 RepID=UPI0037A7BEE7